jgi:hypothetical protein
MKIFLIEDIIWIINSKLLTLSSFEQKINGCFIDVKLLQNVVLIWCFYVNIKDFINDLNTNYLNINDLNINDDYVKRVCRKIFNKINWSKNDSDWTHLWNWFSCLILICAWNHH